MMFASNAMKQRARFLLTDKSLIAALPNRMPVRFNTARSRVAVITRLGDGTVFAYTGSGN